MGWHLSHIMAEETKALGAPEGQAAVRSWNWEPPRLPLLPQPLCFELCICWAPLLLVLKLYQDQEHRPRLWRNRAKVKRQRPAPSPALQPDCTGRGPSAITYLRVVYPPVEVEKRFLQI